jgi:GTP pyrophosphokinase
MNAYCKSKGYVIADLLKPEYKETILRKYGFREWDAVLAAIGHGGLKEGQVVNKLHELYEEDHKKQLSDEEVLREISEHKPHMHSKGQGSIIVKGIHDVAVRFSKCCNPVPGDPIVGFVTRGRGVSIHRADCVNVVNLDEENKARVIEAAWAEGALDKKEAGFVSEINIYANDRAGLLNDVTKNFFERNINILKVNTMTSKHGIATLTISFEVKSIEELQEICGKLQNIKGVQAVKRTNG